MFTDIVDAFNDYSSELLRQVAQSTEELADYHNSRDSLDDTNENRETEEQHEDIPDDVPSKTSIMIKEITDNQGYWQWRNGDKASSHYKRLESPDLVVISRKTQSYV